MDYIRLEDIGAGCVLGILPEERTVRRPVSVDVAIGLDLSAASLSDDISDTIDTRAVESLVVSTVSASSDGLVEQLAGRIADSVLINFPSARSVEITLRKPGALAGCKGVSVTINRSRA